MKPIAKKITQRDIARLAKIGPDFLCHIIRGPGRHCSPAVALRLEREATGISRVTWVWGKPSEIREAVDKACRK